jgi:hypothetical protein
MPLIALLRNTLIKIPHHARFTRGAKFRERFGREDGAGHGNADPVSRTNVRYLDDK